MSHIFIASLFALSILIFSPMQRVYSAWEQNKNKVTCNPSMASPEVCIYQVANVSQAKIPQLISDAFNFTFQDLMPPSDQGWAQKRGNQIIFKIPDQKKREIFIQGLDIFDTLEDLSISPKVLHLTFRIYAIESSAFKNFEAGLSMARNKNNPADGKMPRATIENKVSSTGLITSGLQLNLGNLTSILFGLHLDLSRLSAWSSDSITIDTDVTNGENINVGQNRKTFNKEVSSLSATESANIGFNISGRVAIDEKNRKFSMTDVNVNYNSPSDDPNSITTQTYLNRGSIPMINMDAPYVLLVRSETIDKNSKGRNLIISKNSSSDTVNTKLILVISGTIANQEHQEIGQENNSSSTVRPELQYSSDPSRKFMDVLSSKLPEGFVLSVGKGLWADVLFGQIAGFRIDPLEVPLELANQTVVITETNTINKKLAIHYKRWSDLAERGIFFKTISFEEMARPCIERADHCQSIPIKIKISENDSPTAESAEFEMNYKPELQSVLVLRKLQQEASSDQKKTAWWKTR